MFQSLDYLVYSSHKTTTQTLVGTILSNQCSAINIHTMSDIDIHSNADFLRNVEEYNRVRQKKLKIISVIRNPCQRLRSSFFQTYHTSEVRIFNLNPEHTTVAKHSVEQLFSLYKTKIFTKTLPYFLESLDEILEIFNIDICNQMQKRGDSYFFENELVELYVLDFERIITDKMMYLNRVLGTNWTTYTERNMTKYKVYKNKYEHFKRIQDDLVEETIQNHFNPFYFSAFS
jgi:hypothetical protein